MPELAAMPPPPVELLTRRLAECPPDFAGEIVVGAVLADVLEDLGLDPLPAEWHQSLAPPQPQPAHLAWLQAAAVVTWLVADPGVGRLLETRQILEFLTGDLHSLTQAVPPAALVNDADRREELARLLLRAAGVTPAGETEAQAADRLATLDTAARLRVVRESQAAEEHARKVREALARKAAEEAAAKASRE